MDLPTRILKLNQRFNFAKNIKKKTAVPFVAHFGCPHTLKPSSLVNGLTNQLDKMQYIQTTYLYPASLLADKKPDASKINCKSGWYCINLAQDWSYPDNIERKVGKCVQRNYNHQHFNQLK